MPVNTTGILLPIMVNFGMIRFDNQAVLEVDSFPILAPMPARFNKRPKVNLSALFRIKYRKIEIA
jgi:hypothetical protein